MIDKAHDQIRLLLINRDKETNYWFILMTLKYFEILYVQCHFSECKYAR